MASTKSWLDMLRPFSKQLTCTEVASFRDFLCNFSLQNPRCSGTRCILQKDFCNDKVTDYTSMNQYDGIFYSPLNVRFLWCFVCFGIVFWFSYDLSRSLMIFGGFLCRGPRSSSDLGVPAERPALLDADSGAGLKFEWSKSETQWKALQV